MFLTAVIVKIIGLISYVILALLALKSHTDIKVRRFFFIYLFGMIFWTFTSLMVHFSKNADTALFWYNLLLSGFGLQSILFFPFTRAFLKIEKQKILTYLSYAACLSILVIGLSAPLFKTAYIGKAGYYIVELHTTIYLLSTVVYFFWGYGVYNLIIGLKREKSPLQKNRIKYPLVGAIIVIIGLSSNYTVLQNFPVDFICNLINAIFIGYAVIRYRLLDIRIVLKRSFIYFTAICGLIGIYILSVVLSGKIFNVKPEYISICSGIFALLILVVLFMLFKRKEIQNLFGSLLFKEKFNYQKVLENFSGKATTILDTELLINILVRTVFETVRVNCVYIMLFDKETRKYAIKTKLCLNICEIDDLILKEDDVFIRWLKNNRIPLWKEEMKINPLYKNLLKQSSILFNYKDASLVVPIIHKEGLIGILILGEKISGKIYNDDDMGFLTTISNLTATAIANALSYREVERRLSEQTLLFVLSETFRRPQKLEKIMDSLIKVLVNFLNLDYCAIVSSFGKKKCITSYTKNISEGVKKEIESLCMNTSISKVILKNYNSKNLLDIADNFEDRKDLDDTDRKVLLSSLYLPLMQRDKTLGLIMMSNWLGKEGIEQRIELLHTILAIVSQGMMMHQAISDLVNVESYNENILNSISTMGDMLIVFGFDGKIKRVNSATCNLLGYSETELIGKEIGLIIHEKEKVFDQKMFRKFSKDDSIKNYELTYRAKNGKLIFVLFSGSVMFDSSSKTKEIVGIARDITELKKTEEIVRKSEEKYRTLFEEVQDVVFTCDINGRFIDINPAGAELLGYNSKDELLTIDMANDLFFNSSDYDMFHDKIFQQGYIRDYELNLKKKDGQEVNVIVTANVMHDKYGEITAYRGIMRDVTEQRALQKQLIQAQKMESIGTLAGGVAHDFNNIMCAILGYASIMKMDMKKDNQFFKYLDTIESSASRAAKLTDQLLAFARAGKYDVRIININNIVSDTVNLLKETFDRSIEIEADLYPQLPSIEGDANQIQQIILNICVNARDAMPNGGQLTIATGVKQITRHYVKTHLGAMEGDYVTLSVKDTGAGIDKSIIQRIFDPFFTTKGAGKGTGLGLSVVYGVVKNHGGYVDARSDVNKGTTFEIFLPMCESSKIEEQKREVEVPKGGNELILIVDDEKPICNIGKEILERYGYKTLVAYNGEEAIELYKSNREKIKLTIIDMIMPKLGGLETFLKLKEINSYVKALLSTGYSQTERVQEILNSGVKGFIKKPYNANELLLKVRGVLDL